MPGFVTEVGNIDNCRRIIRDHGQFRARIQRFQALARLENGQGAQQSPRIECVWIIGHAGDVVAMFQPVHRDVTIPQVTPPNEWTKSKPCLE